MRVRIRQQGVNKKLKKLKKELRKVPKLGHQKFVKETPIRSGNARRNTKLRQGDLIDADYAYAKRLDEGWSKQAPLGMVLPTMLFVKKLVRRIMILGK